MAETGMYAQRLRGAMFRQSHRKKGNVVEVASSSPTEVSVAESGNGAVRVEVACNTVPSGQPIVWAELHHAERDLCSRISVAHVVGSDKRINVRSPVVGRHYLKKRG